MIWAIGDSHSLIYEHFREIKVEHIGARLMYSIATKGLDLEVLGVNKGDTVIFCLGEIDCRFHIHRHSQEVPYKKVIDALVNNYFMFLLSKVSGLDIKVCVHNLVPPVKYLFDHYNGSIEDRKNYVLYMNKKLNQYCLENGFLFIDVYKHYADDDGFLKYGLSDTYVHISEPSYLRDFLIEKSMIKG